MTYWKQHSGINFWGDKTFLSGTINNNFCNQRNIAKINSLVRSDRPLTIGETVDELNLSFYSLNSILVDDLNVHRVFAIFTSKMLSDEQKEHHPQASQELLNRARIVR